MENTGLFIAVGLPVIFGLALIRLLLHGLQLPFLLRLTLAYGLGMGLLAQWILLLDIFGIPFCREAVAFPLLLISFLIFFFHHRWRKSSIDGAVAVFPSLRQERKFVPKLFPSKQNHATPDGIPSGRAARDKFPGIEIPS